MSFLSRLFGARDEEKEMRDLLAPIFRILDDEKYQLELLHPTIRSLLESGEAYDQDPNGSGAFGFTETNPIPVNGPIGELAYLSRLETIAGQRLLFHRLGAIGTVDVFEAATFDGSSWFILFLDFYHPRRSRLAPEGFRVVSERAQFSGFTRYCANFPYDFLEMKAAERESGLSLAYIPLGHVTDQIEGRVYNRPLAHNAKLELVRGKLSSRLG